MNKVTLEPLHESVLVRPGTPLLHALLAKELKVLMSCGGNGICSTCHVHIRSGMEQLSNRNATEDMTLRFVADAKPTSRLACQARVYGDGVVVDVPSAMYIEKAEDLLELLGRRAPENILHPIHGTILIPKGKIITRTMLEQSRSLDDEVRKLKASIQKHEPMPDIAIGPSVKPFAATGTGLRPPVLTSPPPVKKAPPPPVAPPPTTGSGRLTSPPPKKTTGDSSVNLSRPQMAVPVTSPSSSSLNLSRPDTLLNDAPTVPTLDLSAATAPSPALSATKISTAPMPSPPAEKAKVLTDSAVRLSNSGRRLLGSSGNATSSGVLEPGTAVGHCLLLERLGKTVAGVMFRALHTKLNRPVAVTFLPTAALPVHHEAMANFVSDVRRLAELDLPNVVRILEFNPDPQQPYFVQEFMEGLTVAELIQQSGRVLPDRALAIIQQAAQGLAAAHAHGFVHREVRPANILVNRDGLAKIQNLGLVALTKWPQPAGAVSDSKRLGQVDEAVHYLAPEAAEEHGMLDHRGDIYALGATFYHMVTGQPPFTGSTRNEVILKHLKEPLVPPRRLVPDVHDMFGAVLQIMMAKRPEQRFQSYEPLLLMLKELRNLARSEMPGLAVLG